MWLAVSWALRAGIPTVDLNSDGKTGSLHAAQLVDTGRTHHSVVLRVCFGGLRARKNGAQKPKKPKRNREIGKLRQLPQDSAAGIDQIGCENLARLSLRRSVWAALLKHRRGWCPSALSSSFHHRWDLFSPGHLWEMWVLFPLVTYRNICAQRNRNSRLESKKPLPNAPCPPCRWLRQYVVCRTCQSLWQI